MSRKRQTRAALGVLGILGVALTLVTLRPRRHASAPSRDDVAETDGDDSHTPPSESDRPAAASPEVDRPHAQSFGVAGSFLLALGIVAGYVLLIFLMAEGLVRGWVQLRALDHAPRPTATDYWLQVAISVAPGILVAIWAWTALGQRGGRVRTVLASACGVWTVATSMSFVNGRAHTVTAGDISARYGVSRDAAEFIQAAATPTVAAILASVVYYFAVAAWWVLRQRRSPGLRLARGPQIAITAVYVVLMLATILGVGSAVGMEYLG